MKKIQKKKSTKATFGHYSMEYLNSSQVLYKNNGELMKCQNVPSDFGYSEFRKLVIRVSSLLGLEPTFND